MQGSFDRYLAASLNVFYRGRFARYLGLFSFGRRVLHATGPGAGNAGVANCSHVVQDVNVDACLGFYVFVNRYRRFNGIAKGFDDFNFCLALVGFAHAAVR